MLALLLTLTGVTAAAPAAADSDPPAYTLKESSAAASPRWPQRLPRLDHWFVAGDLSSCTRSDLDVGAAGFCGEFSSGVDFPLGRAFRVDLEQGIGAMSRVTVGSSALGLRTGSGGVFLSARALLGYDITPLFFIRGGAQLRCTDSLSTIACGPQGVADMGTRVGDRVELGLRGFVGADGVVVTGGTKTEHDLAVSFGAGLLVRVFIR